MAQQSLVEEFEQRLRAAFPYEPTDGQERLLYVFSKFLFSDKDRCALIIRGYAGTGKTTVTGAIVKALRDMRRKVVLMAPTGRAAKVLSSFSDHPAYTIHRTIYNQAGGADSGISFNLSANRRKDTLFIVDEASMIGDAAAMQSEGGFDHRDLLDDLIEYVFSGEGCRLLLIGDSAQLPPVGSDESPALNKALLERRFFLTIAELELNEVVRQELDSGILFNANALRMQLQAGQTGFPRLDATGFPDLIRLGGEDLQDTIESLYGKYGEQEVAIITRSNKRANLFNQQVRNRILWREEDIAAGDLLMVVRNNYHWLTDYKDAPTSFIANGDTLEVQRVNKYQELYGLKFADVTVRMIDYPDFQPIDVKVMLDVIDLEKANLGFADLKKLYHAVAEDYMHLGNRRAIHQAIMKDPFYNALQIKFAYAVTCHKSQGGQWPAVIVDQGYLTEEMLDISLLRWFYTAFTRAQTELYLLNFSDEFF